MTERVQVEPALVRWALERSRFAEDHSDFPRYNEWAEGTTQPTFRQLEKFARATHTPVGYLFLSEPPVEELPIPDFRTFGDREPAAPSPNLLDTIHQCQQRQDWYREFALGRGYETNAYVGVVDVETPVAEVASQIRSALRFDLEERASHGTWEDSRRYLIDAAEDLGFLVMVSGIVGSDTHRTLDPREFRGFALHDTVAPLVFVNGADTKAGQIFTLIHELAHLWSGRSGISDASMRSPSRVAPERWANEVAAEVLVPIVDFQKRFGGDVYDLQHIESLASRYRVSTLVIIKRAFDAKLVSWDDFQVSYEKQLARLAEAMAARPAGGNFYYTQPLRVSQNFARAVITDALEGRTLYRDASKLLGAAKRSTFDGLAAYLGVA